MTRYLIQELDPTLYKSELLEFWDNYLPGTPVERFSWMNANPDGKPIWYFATDKESNNLAGTVSIMPRVMIYNGKVLRAGIIGDFMIAPRYRAYGPALDLQKKVVASLEDKDLDLLYTLPNKSAFNLSKRAGLKIVAGLDYYIKPISMTYYLDKYVNHSIAKVFSPAVKTLLTLTSKETYILCKGHCQEIKDIDSSFDVLWERLKEKRTGLVSNHGSKYLRWRYFEDPALNVRIITYQEQKEGEMQGYIVFTVTDNIMEIIDLVGLQHKHENRLLKKLINIASKERLRSINMRLSARNDFYKGIKKFGFFKTKSDTCVLACGMNDRFYSEWPYVEGYRNI